MFHLILIWIMYLISLQYYHLLWFNILILPRCTFGSTQMYCFSFVWKTLWRENHWVRSQSGQNVFKKSVSFRRQYVSLFPLMSRRMRTLCKSRKTDTKCIRKTFTVRVFISFTLFFTIHLIFIFKIIQWCKMFTFTQIP